MTSTLISCSPLGKYRIQRNDEIRALIVDSILVRFTPKEYHLILLLLPGLPMPDTRLAVEVYSCNQMDSSLRECLDKHIDKIRSKLRPSDLDVYRIAKYGYILLVIPNEE